MKNVVYQRPAARRYPLDVSAMKMLYWDKWRKFYLHHFRGEKINLTHGQKMPLTRQHLVLSLLCENKNLYMLENSCHWKTIFNRCLNISSWFKFFFSLSIEFDLTFGHDINIFEINWNILHSNIFEILHRILSKLRKYEKAFENI